MAREVEDLFHGVRKAGNAAAHDNAGPHQEALHQLKAARREAEMIERLAALQAQAMRAPAEVIEAAVAQAVEAAQELDLDEADTRRIIDRQLRAAGWEADTPTPRWSEGVRPQKGRNLAIAEWPTESGPADYALFIGLAPGGGRPGAHRRKGA